MTLANAQNEAETKALVELREKSKDFLPDDVEDHLLLRFLRARDLNVNSATNMFKKYVDWKNTNADLIIISDPGWKAPDVIIKDVKYKFTGLDEEGRPVLWIPMGRWEIRQHIQNGCEQDVFRFFYQFLNEVVAKLDIQRMETGATQAVVILDMEELWFRKVAHYPCRTVLCVLCERVCCRTELNIPTLQACLRFFKEFEAYYPEILYVIYIVNTHSIFTYIFKLVSQILSTRTIGKIKIFSRNETVWKPVLLANIPAKAIPFEYGGDGPKVLL